MPWVGTEFQEVGFVFGTVIISIGLLVLLGRWWES